MNDSLVDEGDVAAEGKLLAMAGACKPYAIT
jgi:hypothetical protein